MSSNDDVADIMCVNTARLDPVRNIPDVKSSRKKRRQKKKKSSLDEDGYPRDLFVPVQFDDDDDDDDDDNLFIPTQYDYDESDWQTSSQVVKVN